MGKPVQETSISSVLIEPDEDNNYYFYQQEEEEQGFTSSAKRLKQCTGSLHHSLPPPFVACGLLSLKQSQINDFRPLYHPQSLGLPYNTTLAGTESKIGTVSPMTLSPTLSFLRFPNLTENKETSSIPPLTRKRTLDVISSSLPTGRPMCPPPLLPRLATGARLVRRAPAPRTRS